MWSYCETEWYGVYVAPVDNTSSYMNEDVIEWLRDDWEIQIIRVPIGVTGNSAGCDVLGDKVLTGSSCMSGVGVGYTGKQFAYKKAREVVDACIKHGIYVILDWHTHDITLPEATEFFETMATEYGDTPNVMYEIFNEPDRGAAKPLYQEEDWPMIKEYSEEMIAKIRDIDPDNIIMVGTPDWDQRLDLAAADPITQDNKGRPVNDIVYVSHFYADSHRDWHRDQVQKAIDADLAVFVTECSNTDASGNSTPNYGEWNKWMDLLEDNDIGFTKWFIGEKNEVSAALKQTAPKNGNWDYDDDLTPEGRFARDLIKDLNSIPEPCSNVPCTLTVDESTKTYGTAFGTYLVDVSTSDTFTASSSDESWVLAEVEGSRVKLTVQQNTGSEREATITVAGCETKAFVVQQLSTSTEILVEDIDDSDDRVVYGGSWEAKTNGLDYNGTFSETNQNNSWVELTFVGTGIEIFGRKAAWGNATATLDLDGDTQTISFNTSGTGVSAQESIISIQNLENKEHTIRITHTGSSYTMLDYFKGFLYRWSSRLYSSSIY